MVVKMTIRQPIVAVLGHVDHGKTLLLDKIRGTAVVSKEFGGITQHSGASEIPTSVIKKICGKMLDKMKIKLEIPGLLFLDTPGHAAFTSIRKRGSSIADLAILIIDMTEGLKPQTIESIQFLKEFKTPFVIAANKIDKVPGWVSYKDECFLESFEKQPAHSKENFENKFYELLGQISEHGFDVDRFDKVSDFRKQIAVIPISAMTGEGIAELLVTLAGLSQVFLKDKLEIKSKIGKGSILEIKETRGLGLTADIILYDGVIKKGDWLVIGGREPIATKIKALLKPPAMKEIRVEKEFEQVESAAAAVGIKVAAPELDKAIAGSPVLVVKEKDVEKAKKELKEDVEDIEIERAKDGVTLKADTLGSLEALIKMLKDRGIEIKKAEVGAPTRKDVMEIESISDNLKKVMFVFNLKIPEEIKKEAKDRKVKILSSNVIYKLFDEYDEWIEEEKKLERKRKLESITMPCKVKILKGFVFRQSNPAVVGVEVMEGEIKTGVKLKKGKKEIGIVKDLQIESEHADKAGKGERVAVSIDGGVVGRNINEGDELTSMITREDLKILKELGMEKEIELAREILGK
ncbi:MAG: translation initiation factor IF-2 [Candidatus Aenigmarchaeota archaeon]|nr:translation initiation factor IF-2 [Candidatus Aenigmarchaeota archaeon]